MIIGIDPDLVKSGIAVFIKVTTPLITAKSLFELFKFIEDRKDDITTVYVEAGYLNSKSNFHYGTGAAKRERVAKNVGENHATAKHIVAWCRSLNIPTEEVRPNKHKAKPEYVEQYIGHKFVVRGMMEYKQEMADAVMIIPANVLEKYIKKENKNPYKNE